MFLSTNILHLRKEKKLTAIGLSDVLGKSRSVVGQYEKGTTLPPLDVLIKMHNYFKIDLETLVFLDLRKIPLIDIQQISAESGRTMFLPEKKKSLKEMIFDMESVLEKMKTAIREQEK